VDASGRKRLVLSVATLSFFVQGLSLFSYPAVSSIVSGLLALSNTQSGLVTSSFGLAYALLQIPGGILADRFGESKTLFISLLVVAVAPLVMIIGRDFTSALISRGIAGAACGVIVPSSVRLTSSWFPRGELDRAMGVFGSGWAASQVLSFLVLPFLLFGMRWEFPLLFVVLFSLMVAGLAFFPIAWQRRTQEGTGVKSGDKGTRSRVDVEGLFTHQLFALTLPNFAALAVGVGVLAWAPLLLESTIGLNYADAGSLAALLGIGAVFASLLGGYGATKIGVRGMVGISMTMAVVFPILLGNLSGSLLSASVWLLGVGFAEMLYFPAVFALVPYASVQGPAVAGLEFGIFNTMSNMGTFISPVLVGYFLDSGIGFAWAFTLLGLFALAGLAGAMLVRAKMPESGTYSGITRVKNPVDGSSAEF
jgi:MFS transporter, ACS family, D-galactonate transporter